MEAQNEMEGDEKNPFDSAFIQFHSTNPDIDHKLYELTDLAKTLQKTLESYKLTLRKIQSMLQSYELRAESFKLQEVQGLIEKWKKSSVPVFHSYVSSLEKYESEINDFKKETEQLQRSIEQQEELITQYQETTVKEKLKSVEDFSKSVKDKYAADLEDITNKIDLAKEDLALLFTSLEQENVINKYKELKEGGERTYHTQFDTYLLKKLTEFNEKLRIFQKLKYNENKIKAIISLLESGDEDIAKYFNDVYLEKITNDSNKASLEEVIRDITSLNESWSVDAEYPLIGRKVREVLNNMKENYEKEFSKVPELIDVPVKTGSTKIFRTNESYVSDLNYVTTLKGENEQKIESLNKKIEMLTGNYEIKKEEIKELLENF